MEKSKVTKKKIGRTRKTSKTTKAKSKKAIKASVKKTEIINDPEIIDRPTVLKTASYILQEHINKIEPTIIEICKKGGIEIEEVYGFIQPKNLSVKEATQT